MAGNVITNNKVWMPFWGDKMSFVKGLDPLGLQNASEKTYSHLLPGLNNVTGLIRAYSFYCWLLREYTRQINSTSPAEQKQFVRKAEYLLALLSYQHNIAGVSGVNYAARQFATVENEFDILAGIYKPDGSTANTYWDFHFGVFGAYYLGSMRQIGIIEEPVNDIDGHPLGIYRVTDERHKALKVTGYALAEAFESEMNSASKALFLACIRTGKVSRDQLDVLAEGFNLRKIRQGSTEWKLLLDLLLDADEPRILKENPDSMRRGTLFHVLRLAQRRPYGIAARELAMYAYEIRGNENDLSDNCLTGWYYYQLNEYYQFACTAMLNGCLAIIVEEVGPGWISLDDFIQETVASISEAVRIAVKSNDMVLVHDLLSTELEDEEKIFDLIRTSTTEIRITAALLLLCKLYQVNGSETRRLKNYILERGLSTDQDVLVFLEYMKKVGGQTLSDFIASFLMHKILNRHRIVAYSKMGNGNKSTEKFIIEDNFIRVIDNFEPVYTGPRLVNLTAFMHDLGLVKIGRKITLTVTGEELLQKGTL